MKNLFDIIELNFRYINVWASLSNIDHADQRKEKRKKTFLIDFRRHFF